jgi:hypothetical protein
MEKGKGVFRRPGGSWGRGGGAMRRKEERKKEREKRLEGVDGYWVKTVSGSSGSEGLGVGLKRCMLH